jgi:putative methionine-R-sulfoxide reductase with GAF domain
MKNRHAKRVRKEDHVQESVTAISIEQRSRRNWILLTGTAILTTTVLATVLVTVLEPYVSPLWPWARTQLILPVTLAVLVMILVIYVDDQQRVVARLRQQLAQHVRRHHERLLALLNVSRIMGMQTGVQPVFDSITKTCLEAYGCDQVSLMCMDKEAGELVVQSIAGGSSLGLGLRQPVGRGVSGWVADQRQSVVLGTNVDAKRYVGFTPRANAPTASMVVPIVVRDDLVGVLSISSQVGGQVYDQEDLRALEIFAQNAGTCIRHAEQAEWMRLLIETNEVPPVHPVEDGAPTT